MSVFSAEERAADICAARGWKLGSELGSGGSAAVYAVQTSKGAAALKVFFPRFIQGAEGEITRNRLQVAQANLTDHDCPSLVRLFEINDFENAPFMLMEQIAGHMLTDVLASVPPGAVQNIVRQVATAAKFLEDHGVTHRDIKSDNIVVDHEFRRATLVDIGVVRAIDDPIGSGTDDDGQLPFVATARYSSPEYMFRLLAPGPELWRALNYYQLGGLIHDLIEGAPLFEDVVSKASSNRYLIAHAVATKMPAVRYKPGVPEYLSTLALRCLQKDPALRLASVSWEDFLERDRVRENESFLGIRSKAVRAPNSSPRDISVVASAVEGAIDERLVANNIDCKHSIETISKTEAIVTIVWTPPLDGKAHSQIDVVIRLVHSGGNINVSASARLSNGGGDSLESSPLSLIEGDAGDYSALMMSAYDLFLDVSGRLMAKVADERGEA